MTNQSNWHRIRAGAYARVENGVRADVKRIDTRQWQLTIAAPNEVIPEQGDYDTMSDAKHAADEYFHRKGPTS